MDDMRIIAVDFSCELRLLKRLKMNLQKTV